MVLVVTNTRVETEVGVERGQTIIKLEPQTISLSFETVVPQSGRTILGWDEDPTTDALNPDGFRPDAAMYFYKDINCGIQEGETLCSCAQNCTRVNDPRPAEETAQYLPCCANFHETRYNFYAATSVIIPGIIFRQSFQIYCNNATIPRYYMALRPGHGLYYHPVHEGVELTDVRISFRYIEWADVGIEVASDFIRFPWLPNGAVTAFEQYDYCPERVFGQAGYEADKDFERNVEGIPLCLNNCGYQAWAGCFCDPDCWLDENRDCCDDSTRYCSDTISASELCPQGMIDCQGNCVPRYYRRYVGDGVCDQPADGFPQGVRGFDFDCNTTEFTSYDGGDCNDDVCPGGVCPLQDMCPNLFDFQSMDLSLNENNEFIFTEGAAVSMYDCNGRCVPIQALLDNYCDADDQYINLNCSLTTIPDGETDSVIPQATIAGLEAYFAQSNVTFDIALLDYDRNVCLRAPIPDACTATPEVQIGDGFCDQSGGFNTEDCLWDGGDCCEETCLSSFFNCDPFYFDCKDPAYADIQ